MSARAAILLAAWVLLASAARANPHLDRCRSLEGEFDYKGMAAECGLVVGDIQTSPEDRIEAHRLLGFAHTALGDDDAAREWFVRLLLLDPEHALPAEVSPRFREVFSRAADHVREQGRVTVTHQPPSAESSLAGGALSLSFDVKDALSRVRTASVVVDALVDGQAGEPVTATLSRLPAEQPGVVRFDGELPDPVRGSGSVPASYTLRYRLVLANGIGKEVTPDPPLPPITLPRRGVAGGQTVTGEGGEMLLWGGAAVASGLLVAGIVGGGIAIYCATGRCSSQAVQPPVGYVNVSVDGAAGATP